MMKISCTTLCCPNWSLEMILERFKQYGYDAVDFRGLGDEMEVWHLPAFSTGAAETVRRISDVGLEVSAFCSSARMFHPDPSEREKDVAEVAQYAHLCREFGAPTIRIFGGALKGTPVEQALETAAATLREMAGVAGEDVMLAVETHDDWVCSSMIADAMKKVELPNVGVLWDLHHPYRLGGESPGQTYDNIGQLTVATHVKDSRITGEGEDDYEYCLGGEGDVPLEEMVALLKDGGYDGYLTLEWEKKWHPEIAEPEEALPAYAEYMKKLI